jgi:hypothetical protein
MSPWQGKSKGKPLGYKIFVFILRTGGVLPAYLLLRLVTLYTWRFLLPQQKAHLAFSIKG